METMMQSAVCLLEQAAEKFKNKTVFEDKDGSISFEELREKSRIIGSELIKRVETGRKCPVIVYLPEKHKINNQLYGFALQCVTVCAD